MKVRDWMTTDTTFITPDTSVKKAFALMKQKGFRHLPVVKGKKLVGIVADRDLRRPEIADVFREWDQLYRLSDEIHVEDVMVAPAVTVTPETDITRAATMFVEKKFGALPVINNADELVGILTTQDVLRALVSQVSKR